MKGWRIRQIHKKKTLRSIKVRENHTGLYSAYFPFHMERERIRLYDTVFTIYENNDGLTISYKPTWHKPFTMIGTYIF